MTRGGKEGQEATSPLSVQRGACTTGWQRSCASNRRDDISPAWRTFAASTFLTAKALAARPHPRRELTLMPRFGFSCPQLGMAAGAPLRGG
jgi:hypothetical protein